jgi:cleavage stimulation factor subunit 3
MELDHDEFYRVENIFSRSLLNIPNVKLWSMYLDYIRRRNNLINDPDGRARQTVSQAYEFVLNNIGIDKDAGPIWKDYLAFLKSGPGTPGGANWQDQQKMDSLRKAYRQAIVVPTQEVEGIWREYYTFETQLNVTTGRKFLQEITPSMLAAKQALVPIQNITKNVVRSTTPKLPPLPGFDGDVEHDEQVDIWKRWIQWEKEDHLELRDDDLATYYKRILFLYKQATITMRFEPYFWYDAAEFCFANHTEENKLNEEGAKFLENGIQANPESALLAYKLADRTETTTVKEEGDDAIKRRGEQVRAPYSKLLDALYGLMKVNDVREEKTISRIQENFAQQIAQSPVSDVDEEEQQAKQKILQDIQDAQIRGVQAGSKTQNELLKKMVTFTWIALMRAMRRVQGKGKIGDPVGGMRSVFNEARKRGHLTSDVYVASALLEHHCYKDPAATKIFERGVRLYPLDENFALEYLKHLIDINDLTSKLILAFLNHRQLTRSLQMLVLFLKQLSTDSL